MLPLKDLGGRSVGENVTGWGLKILKELEGPHGRARMVRRAQRDRADSMRDYSIVVQLVKDYL